jgi:hypothetical protein
VDDVLMLLGQVNPPLTGQIRSSNVVLSCPFALVSGHRSTVDHTPSLGLLPDESDNGGVWNCFSCGRKGTMRFFFLLLGKELSYDVSVALALLDGMLAPDPETILLQLPSYESHYSSVSLPYRTFPESWLAPYRGRIAQVLLDRGISMETVKAWEIGFDRPNQRAIYPVRDHDQHLVGVVGGLVRMPRQYEVKYKNYWHRLCRRCEFPLDHRNGQYTCASCGTAVSLENALDGFRKAKHLFGAQWFHPGLRGPKASVAVVVEGTVDALAVWQAVRGWEDPLGCPVSPLALLGSDSSKTQANQIAELTADRRIVVFLDNDDAGIKGNDRLYELLGNRLRFFRVGYDPDEEPGGDPASLKDRTPRPPEQIRRMIGEAKVIMRG